MVCSTIDSSITIDTPEGVEIALDIAGPVVRACAWAIDFVIRALIFIVLAVSYSYLFDSHDRVMVAGLFSILAFALEWLYPTLFEGLTSTSPGKRAFGLRVLQQDGTPLTMSSSVIRNFLRAADFLPFFYATGLIAMVINQRFQRLGDMAAGTLVVYTPKSRVIKDTEVVDSLPIPAGLNLQEKMAIVNFAERCSGLSESRQIELANTLYPFTGEKDLHGVQTLKAWANFITRGQNYA